MMVTLLIVSFHYETQSHTWDVQKGWVAKEEGRARRKREGGRERQRKGEWREREEGGRGRREGERERAAMVDKLSKRFESFTITEERGLQMS
jgi:hypothetical protein